jgi:hypothetical protein
MIRAALLLLAMISSAWGQNGHAPGFWPQGMPNLATRWNTYNNPNDQPPGGKPGVHHECTKSAEEPFRSHQNVLKLEWEIVWLALGLFVVYTGIPLGIYFYLCRRFPFGFVRSGYKLISDPRAQWLIEARDRQRATAREMRK